MPSEKILEGKKQQVEELKSRLEGAVAGVVVSYEGISVADDTKLRKELREAGVKYTVTKNTLLRIAIDGTALAGLDDVLSGTTAIATSADDYVAAARILCNGIAVAHYVHAGWRTDRPEQDQRPGQAAHPRGAACHRGQRAQRAHRRLCARREGRRRQERRSPCRRRGRVKTKFNQIWR